MAQTLKKFQRWLYPDLRYLPAREEADAITRKWVKQEASKISNWLFVLLIMAMLFGLSVGQTLLLKSWHIPGAWLVVINVAVFGVIGGVIPIYFWHRPYTRFLRRELQARGVAVCVRCGYDLRAQREPRCPECGERFDESLLDQPAQA